MENGVEATHLVIASTIVDNHNEIRSHALIDSGAPGYAFIDKAFAEGHNFPLFELKEPRPLTGIDGWTVSSWAITHITKIGLSINNRPQNDACFGYHA